MQEELSTLIWEGEAIGLAELVGEEEREDADAVRALGGVAGRA
jgi:hypothetical protein